MRRSSMLTQIRLGETRSRSYGGSSSYNILSEHLPRTQCKPINLKNLHEHHFSQLVYPCLTYVFLDFLTSAFWISPKFQGEKGINSIP